MIPTLAGRRGGSLKWYTRDTGAVAPLYGFDVHFGLNTKDLITVYAGDIGKLPEWQQQIWAGFNVAPDGKVSHELLAAQVEAEPAPTSAPETLFVMGLAEIDDACNRKWGKPLFQRHSDRPAILQRIHRFRALTQTGLLELAKDIARVTADSIDVGPLHVVVSVEKSPKPPGSLKSLERAVATVVSATDARALTGPLAGIYELRLGDAHLPSSKLSEAFKLAGVDASVAPIQQGLQLVESAARAMHAIAETLGIGTRPGVAEPTSSPAAIVPPPGA